MAKKVLVTGCYDLLHSGHIEFFKEASGYGDLYVGIGSDATILEYKHHKPMFPEQERLFMVKAVRYVKDAFINQGVGVIDFLPTLDLVKPDVFVVNTDGGSEQKRRICSERGIEYIELQRIPAEGFEARYSSAIRMAIRSGVGEGTKNLCEIPTRLDIAGTWIDQPFVNWCYPGWALTVSLEPNFEIRERCGLSTSTRNSIMKLWPFGLPKMDPETMARLVFYFESHSERENGFLAGAQDSIGICVPGLSRHYYNKHFWPEKIETCDDEETLKFLENHIVLVPIQPRPSGCNVVCGSDITTSKVKKLADAAEACWTAIIDRDLNAFASSYQASFDAQISMFPGMVTPYVDNLLCPEASVQPYIDRYGSMDDVLALKMSGAGGGGYLALVVMDAGRFSSLHRESIRLNIRRAH